MAAFPTISAGQKITSSLLTSMMPAYVFKTASQAVTSSTTLVDDNELLVPVAASSIYEVDFFVYFASLQASGIKTSWTVPSGATGNKRTAGPGQLNATNANGETTEMKWAVHGTSTSVSYTDPRNSASSQVWLWESCILTIGSTAGNVQFQWAQNVSNATGTVVQVPSYARYRQVG